MHIKAGETLYKRGMGQRKIKEIGKIQSIPLASGYARSIELTDYIDLGISLSQCFILPSMNRSKLRPRYTSWISCY